VNLGMDEDDVDGHAEGLIVRRAAGDGERRPDRQRADGRVRSLRRGQKLFPAAQRRAGSGLSLIFGAAVTTPAS
jgi:hypothetical protein